MPNAEIAESYAENPPALMMDLPKPRGPRDISRTFKGIPVVVEYLQGDIKKTGPGDEGFWMSQDYGYIPNTSANDGTNLDVFLGPDGESDRVFIYSLYKKDGTFDENKVLLGYTDEKHAIQAMKTQYSFYDAEVQEPQIMELSLDDLRGWIKVQGLKARKDQDILRVEEKEEERDAEAEFKADGNDERPLIIVG